MKKIIIVLFLFFCFIVNVNALSKFYLGEKVPNMYIESKNGNLMHNGAPFVIRRDDSNIVYCLNPFLYIDTNNYYNEFKYNASLFNLTEEQLEKINLISYFGYNYKNHTDLKWYGITQYLIWKAEDFEEVYFTDSYYGNKIVAYENEIKEIESLIKEYYEVPSFSEMNFEFSINSTYEIEDKNRVINNFEILESDIEVSIVDNNLKINTKDEGVYEISFIKRSSIKNNYVLYNYQGAQSVIYPGSIKDIMFSIEIEVSSGSIKINKLDSENLVREEATLSGAIYGLYNEIELVTTLKIDEKGIAFIDKIPFGKYYVRELTPSLGYNIDETIYEFEITSHNKDILINSYEEVITGDLLVNKYYGYSSNYKLEDGAIFELYDNNKNLINTYMTSNGIIQDKLVYGNYYLVQKYGIDGYSYVNDLNIFIEENKEYLFNLYDEKIVNEEVLIVEVPNTYKNSYTYLISLALIILGIIFIKQYKKTTS